MRLIDADELAKVKFHALPYTHITPSDLKGMQTEAYERGWNDAIDAIIENAETVETPRKGKWIATHERGLLSHPDSITYVCSECGNKFYTIYGVPKTTKFCWECGAEMEGEQDESS